MQSQGNENSQTEPFSSPIISIFRAKYFAVGASCARDTTAKMIEKLTIKWLWAWQQGYSVVHIYFMYVCVFFSVGASCARDTTAKMIEKPTIKWFWA